MPRCVKCGREIPAGYTYCPNCGAEQIPVAAAAPTPPKKSRRKFLGAGIAVAVAVVLGFLGWRQYGEDLKDWLNRILGGEPTKTTTVTTKPTTPTLTTPKPTTTVTTTPTTTTAATTTTETPTLVWPIDKPVPPERDWEKTVYPYIEVLGGTTTAWGAEGYKLEFFLQNSGEGPSFCTVMELYAGPYRTETWSNPLRDYELVERRTVILHPGEVKRVGLWHRIPAGVGSGTLVACCYDPLYDPREFRMDSGAPLNSLFGATPLEKHRQATFGGYLYT